MRTMTGFRIRGRTILLRAEWLGEGLETFRSGSDEGGERVDDCVFILLSEGPMR